MGLENLKLQEKQSKKGSHVRFDESIIAEHDKERGTRMTIDEPETPFARSPLLSESEDESVHGRHAAQFNLDVVSQTSGRSEDEQAAFKAKRKAHYNEFKMAIVKDGDSDEEDS